MPRERQEKCKKISRQWHEVLQESLKSTPLIQRSVQNKMMAAQLLKVIHDRLKTVSVIDENNIPSDLQKYAEMATGKLQGGDNLPATELGALGQKYACLANTIKEEIKVHSSEEERAHAAGLAKALLEAKAVPSLAHRAAHPAPSLSAPRHAGGRRGGRSRRGDCFRKCAGGVGVRLCVVPLCFHCFLRASAVALVFASFFAP